VDFIYIEIWPPDVEYRRLAEIVLNAVRLSRGKAVVIALYLPASRPANNLLADAVILACGGTRIELGEDARLLADPYFPKHEEISAEMSESLRRLADFAVRNGEWIRPYTLSQVEKEVWANGELNPAFIEANESILTVVRHHATSLIVQLVNLHGLHPHVRWDEAHPAPSPCEKIPIKIRLAQRPSQVLWDCPERIDAPQALGFEYSDGTLTFQIPHIDYIGLVAIHE
jgi:dextranase